MFVFRVVERCGWRYLDRILVYCLTVSLSLSVSLLVRPDRPRALSSVSLAVVRRERGDKMETEPDNWEDNYEEYDNYEDYDEKPCSICPVPGETNTLSTD